MLLLATLLLAASPEPDAVLQPSTVSQSSLAPLLPPREDLATATPDDTWREATPRATLSPRTAAPSPTAGTTFAPRSVLDADKSPPALLFTTYAVAAALVVAALRLFLRGRPLPREIPLDNALFADEAEEAL
jgi:hypothetical protein